MAQTRPNSDARPDSAPAAALSVVTRRDVFDYLLTADFDLYGRLDELPFLSRLYDLEQLPSQDSRFDSASGDIRQHRVNNDDWEDDWIFTDSRLQLGSGPDEILLEFLAQLVHPVVRPDATQARKIVDHLNALLRADGWQLTQAAEISGRPVFKPARIHHGAATAIGYAHVVAATVDTAYISRQVTRMEQAVDTDPELAIGTAKEFLETVCKTILDGTGTAYGKNDDVLALVKKTTAALQLSRDDVDPAAAAADTIRRILSSLAQIAQGTAELRNSYDTGHGRPGQSTGGLGPRHARLVVGSTATLASFLYDTYQERGKPAP